MEVNLMLSVKQHASSSGPSEEVKRERLMLFPDIHCNRAGSLS